MNNAMELPEHIKILVVDDVKSSRQIILRLLEQLGFSNTFECDSVAAALGVLRENEDIELIITDYHLHNNENGIDLLLAARKMPGYFGVRSIVVTSDADQENLSQASATGVDSFLLKPFNLAILKQTLINSLSNTK